MSDKIVQKIKNVVNSRFFLRIFSPAHLDYRKLILSAAKSFRVGGGGCMIITSALVLLSNGLSIEYRV